MDKKAGEDVLLEAVAQTKKAYSSIDQAGSEGAGSHQYGAVAQKLLAAIEDIGDQQWIES